MSKEKLMFSTLLVFAPLALLLVLAVTTKRMAESMTAAVALAMLILHKQNFISGTLESFYKTLCGSSFQMVLMMMTLFGGVIELLKVSGGLKGMSDLVARYAKGRRKPMILAWIMSLLLFADEYLDAITVSLSMSSITDRNKIPREHLAFQVQICACCICALIPFTSWIGFSLGLIKDFNMGFIDYVKAMPMMIYPILMIILALLIAVGVVPKVGVLRKSYERVDTGGETYVEEVRGSSMIDSGDFSDVEARSPIYAIIPIIAIVAGTVCFDNDLLHGALIALIVQFVMYMATRIMTLDEFFAIFFSGVKSLTQLTVILFLGFTLSETCKELGFFDIVIGAATSSLPPFMIPAIGFLITALCVFTMGGCWIVMLITVPVFIPMAMAVGVDPVLSLAAVMSGVTMGYGLCIYSDTVFVCSMGTGVSNLTIVKSIIPYSLTIGAISTAFFIALGLLL